MAKENQTDSAKVATNSYDPKDYNSEKQVDKGLAMTHEQVSDAYVEGTIDGKIDEYRGKDTDLPRGGFEEKNLTKE
ncbi:YozQ family protein [Alkalihalobacillus sp. LMS39]|uniref:YozQ family protein n=1 Tax=Alkalihalobacillus sp. LMS39 TaxID=2924032 RepID=UPI001FB4B2F8|nr:YozQ family protein [Alkalihalobacillus sp. LMS39]UOE95484.1 YozQ family protein [Alkalihalobacillus sp. LMS39]